MELSVLDLVIIGVYLLGTLLLGLFLARKEGAEGYFVNNRKTKLWFLIFTALSTSVGAGTVLGVASTSFSNGISFAITFMLASIIGWSVMAMLAPKIKKFGDETGAYTFGDYLASQYSENTRSVGRFVVLIAYFFATAIQFVAFAQLINVTTSLTFGPALLIVALVTITYTALSGVKGDFFTDAIQFFVMLPVFIILFVKGFQALEPGTLFNVPETYFNIYAFDGPLFFWAGLLFAFPLLISSADAWQRAYAAESPAVARKAFFASGILKVGVIAAAALVGLLAFHLVPGAPADGAMFALMQEILPSGLLGLGLASILAIIMSSVDTGIIVGSSTIAKDYYAVRKPEATPKDILRVGRIASFFFGIGGLILAYVFQDIVVLALVSVQILLIFAPALFGGLIWNVKNKSAAFWSILLGFIVTLAVLFIDTNIAFIPGILVSIIAYIGIIFGVEEDDK